jgi:hypothetical protein
MHSAFLELGRVSPVGWASWRSSEEPPLPALAEKEQGAGLEDTARNSS